MSKGTPTESWNWQSHHKQMLEETSRWIEWALEHPDEVIRIPARPVSEGPWPRGVGQWFWTVVLSDRRDGRVRHWWNLLKRGAGAVLTRR